MKMKSTPTLRFSIQRLFLLTLVSLVAVAMLLSIAASANKANRAAKALQAQEAQAAASKLATEKNSIAPHAMAPAAPLAPGITATLTDNVTPNTTKVAPGATVNYTAVISDAGVSPADDALNAFYNDVLDSNTTYVAGSVHASPIAFNDTYNWVGNTQLDTTARALPAVTANDIAVNATSPAVGTDTFTVTAIAGGATALGGVVTLASPAGSFVYTPPVGRPNIADGGVTVTDSFTYTITNSADATLVGTGTVNIVLTGRVWYLQAGAAGDGRSNTPSGSPSAMSTAANLNSDIFYIFSNAGNLDGTFSLDNSQQLLGQGVALTVNAINLFSASTLPTLIASAAASNGVTLANGNTVRGFNIGNCTGTAILGVNVGTLTINTLSINTTGAGLDLTGVATPTVSVVLGGLTSTGGTKNVNLVGLNGTITLANGALSGASGNAFDVSGGAATITYSGTITNTTARAVNVASMTGGSVALSGAVTGSGSNTGINLATNTGATISFTGLITLNGAASAFVATGGGTVSSTNTGSTIGASSAPTTTALNVTSTLIGSGGLTFVSIASNGASKGIILNTTGQAAGNGGLTVTGTGSTAGSGGTIQNISVRGGEFITTKALSLKNMNFTNANTTDGGTCTDLSTSACNAAIYLNSVQTVTLDTVNISGTTTQEGINGLTVSNFTLSNSTIANCGTSGSVEEGCIKMRELTGTAAITSSDLSFPAQDVVEIVNTVGPGLLLNVNGSTFRDSQSSGAGGNGLQVRSQGTASVIMNVNSSSFLRIRTNGIQATAINSASNDVDVTTSTFDPGTGIGIGLDLDADNTGNLKFNVVNNPKIYSRNGPAINVFGDTNAVINGRINNNPDVQVKVNVGSNVGSGIRANVNKDATARIEVKSNVVNVASDDAGIDLSGIGRVTANPGGATNTLDATVTGNNVTIGATSTYGVIILSATNAGDTNAICANVATNAITRNPTSIFSFRARVPSVNGFFRMNGFVTDAGVTWNNNGNTPINDSSFGGSGTFATCTATLPTNPTITPSTRPQEAGDNARNRMDEGSGSYVSAGATAKAPTELAKPVVATPVAPVSSKVGIASITAKATPKASAVEVARIYRSEAPLMLSHHAVRNNSAASVTLPVVLAGETINVPFGASGAVGTLPAGKTITIKYSATVNVPPGALQASTQGTVSGTNFATVQTDDPDAAGSPNPTITLIDTAITWTGVTSTDWNTASNWVVPGPVVSTYAPGIANTVNDVTIPTAGVTFEPTLSASPITVHSLDLQSGRTLIITGQTLTISGTSGSNLTVNGVINGGSLLFAINGVYGVSGTGSLTSNNVTTVGGGATVTLNSNLQMGHLLINGLGTVDITNRTLSLSGGGASALTVTGTLTTTGSTVVLNGTAAQTIAGTTYNNLTINNTIGAHVTGVTLTGNATVNGVLTLTSSDLATGANTLTMPVAATSGPASGASDVVGNVKRTGFVSGGSALSFGNPFNTIRINSGTAPTDINILLAKNAPTTYATAVLRSYTITPNGGAGITATVRLHYRQSELNGNLETPSVNFNLRRFTAGWKAVVPTTRNTGVAEDNWLENAAVTQFSEWTFATLAPTASGGLVTGRIVDQSGAPVEGAVVRLGGTQNRKFITDANGVYRFENVETNGFYTVTPSRANYSFNPSVRSFSQLGESTEAAFGATLSTSNFDNPLDTPEYFVRQHYIDFLGREPDEAGFNFWSDQILGCGNDGDCISRKRENVSAAYFFSIEFQKTGGLVDGLYRASYGVRPDFAQFMPDTRTVGLGVVVGTDNWEATLNANKEAFANAFVNRAAFHAMYDGMDNSLFVDTLIGHTGVSFTTGERDALVGGLSTGTMTRAEALRSIAENNRFVNAKFNEAFVMMEYFGYLRRDADASGYAFWLNKLNQFGGNFEQAEMVKAFIVSGEYRDRFPR
jgi:hypothetical protein